jgi:ABC-type multidrug transport system fused ATPase/permease subunit
MQDRTVLVIAHRLSTVQNASKILVLEKGQIIETGTHRDLLEQDGMYNRLYNLQFVNTAD